MKVYSYVDHAVPPVDRTFVFAQQPSYRRRGTALSLHLQGALRRVWEDGMEMRGWVQMVGRDFGYAVRTLRRSRGFAAVAALTLALGIGANTAIFTLLDQILLRLLPVKNPHQLVLLTMRGRHYGNNWGGNAISYPMYRDFQDHNEVFSGMFCRFPEH